MDVPDPLGFFDANDKKQEAKARSRSRSSRASSCKSKSRSRSKRSGGGGRSEPGQDSLEARLSRLRKKMEDYVTKNKLDHRVSRILQNMHPSDATKVIAVPLPDDCRNPSGFVVAQIRRTERDVGRPKDYRWDGKVWDEGPKVGGGRDAGHRGRSRDRSRGRRGPAVDRHRDRHRHQSRRNGHSRRARSRSRRRRPRRGRERSRGSSRGDSRSYSCDDSRSYSESDPGSRSRSRRRRR
mmetsp:Transcript_49221/g.107062  ORF Transcript_49221/g.107062 Transcript_49221/m.107062 type:complete len:238 (-) Transcript_49221:211-924(-)